MNDSEKLRKELFSLSDVEYRNFQASLMPNIDKERIIGIRAPVLRSFASKFAKETYSKEFLRVLPHYYYEENNLHGLLIDKIGDYDEAISELDRFLPYVDNWATCDMMKQKTFAQNRYKLLNDIDRWILSDQVYEIRFGIKMLMDFYLGENFKTEYSERVAAVKNDDYYVKMMIAWYFATALAKNYDEVLPYIENRILHKWTHNKAISKANESYRLTADQKEYLKTFRIK